MRGGEHDAVVDDGPEAEAQYRLLFASADALAPELFDRQRLRKFHQHRRRLDVLVLAATGGNYESRQGQGKQKAHQRSALGEGAGAGAGEAPRS